jgi:hypothetical protein
MKNQISKSNFQEREFWTELNWEKGESDESEVLLK